MIRDTIEASVFALFGLFFAAITIAAPLVAVSWIFCLFASFC